MENQSTEIISSVVETVDILPLLIAESVLLLIVLVALPVYAACKSKGQEGLSLKGLGQLNSQSKFTLIGLLTHGLISKLFRGALFCLLMALDRHVKNVIHESHSERKSRFRVEM